MMEEDYLQISGIQHFCFCKRQWALIHVENQWIDNCLTSEGELIHNRAHNPGISSKRDGIITMRGIAVKSEKLKITGICDSVEFFPSPNGISLYGIDGCWQLNPVEYKHGKSKTSNSDRLQVAAQAVCLEEMMCCSIPSASIYYYGSRHRETIEISAELRGELNSTIEMMHLYYSNGYTPNAKKTKSCVSCSLADICIPGMMEKQNNTTVESYINKHLMETEH